MSAITPILMAIACVTPVLGVATTLIFWMRRQKDRAAARIKLLRALLWFLLLIAVTGVMALVFVGGEGIHSITQVAIPFGSLGLVAVGILFQIRESKRRAVRRNS